MTLWLSITALLLALLPGRASAENILFAADFSRGVSNAWTNVAFFAKRTEYSTVRDGTNFFLRGLAQDACSALSLKLDLAPPAKLKLRWRWRIDAVAARGSERDLKTFDHAARVFVAFHTFLRTPRTLNYLWANTEPPGTVLQHPASSRTQLFVLESGNAKAGCWLSEERDVTADWKKAFPREPMPKIVGLGVMTDSDSLGGKLVGDYAQIELVAE